MTTTLRRATESSKGLANAKDKSLSAATLTKKTNSLVYDVDALKSDLKSQSRDVAEQDRTLQDLSSNVQTLLDAFNSLSDVFIAEIEETQQQVASNTRELLERATSAEKAIADLQRHFAHLESNQCKLQESIDRRFASAQDTFSKLALGLYDTQSDVGSLKSTLDQLQMRECEATRLQQNLQSSQDQALEWLQKLKANTSMLQSELCAAKEESSSATVAVAGDVQVLAKECAALRNTLVQQNAKWMNKLTNLKEAMDRQDQMSKDQLTQRLDALSDNLNLYELRSREAMNSLLKSHSRIRIAVDEGMALCNSEIKAVSNECKGQHMERGAQLDQVLQQFATQSVAWTHTHQDLRISVETIAHHLKLGL